MQTALFKLSVFFMIVQLYSGCAVIINAQSADSLDDDGLFFPDSASVFYIGRDFVHNTFQDQEKGLRGMAECNFNLSDAAAPQNLELCDELGLGVVVSQFPHLVSADWLKMSDREIDDYIRKMVEIGGKSKAMVGYQICDEPSSAAFPKLAVAVASLRKYAPGKLAIINLYPNYAALWSMDQIESQLGTKTYREYLEKFVQLVHPDLLSYDNYMVEYSMDLRDSARASQYFSNLLEVREVAAKYSLPFWNIVSSNQIRPFTAIPSPANMALQAYTSLAAGCSGIIWFTYTQLGYRYAPIDSKGHKTLVWRQLQEINRQLSLAGPMIKKLKSTGVFFYREGIKPENYGAYVKNVDSDVPVMIGEFLSKNGNRYLMIVNLSLERTGFVSVKTSIPDEKIWEVSLGDDVPYFSEITDNKKRTELKDAASWSPSRLELCRKNGIWLTAGQGTLIKCSGKSNNY